MNNTDDVSTIVYELEQAVLRGNAAAGYNLEDVENALRGDLGLPRFIPSRGGSLSALHTALVVVGVAAALVVLLIIGKLMLQSRDVDNAPTDPNAPCSIIFTDIQKSTRLWGACPDEMAEAVEAHHAIIRQHIKKYRAYEVKTIGDSFMIACKDNKNAIELSLAIQLALHNHQYRDDTIDQQYAALAEEERCSPRRGFGASSPLLPPSQRKPSTITETCGPPFRGLLVRIGIHRGSTNIKFDEVSKGYDYYGPTVNTASRTEAAAHGGQILLTGAALNGLNRATIGISHVCNHLGIHELRDVTEPLELYQMLPKELAARIFPPLRLGKAAGAQDNTESETCGSQISTKNTSISSGTRTEHAVAAADDEAFVVFKKCISVLRKSERKAFFQKIFTRWGLPADNDDMSLRGCVFKAKKALGFFCERRSVYGVLDEESSSTLSERDVFSHNSLTDLVSSDPLQFPRQESLQAQDLTSVM